MERHWIEAVHDPAYVDEVLSSTVPSSKERRIGFPVTARVARRSLLSSGGTWLAARLALRHGHAANSAGGSHHAQAARSEEHTSELQSLMRISSAVFCLKKKN